MVNDSRLRIKPGPGANDDRMIVRVDFPIEALVELENLRNLQLWKTGLQELPPSLSDMKALKQLELSYNPLKRLP